MLPNLKKVAQDKPHGVRRVCSRAWAADQYLSDTADIMILAKGSITTLIQNSPTFKGWFQQHNEKLDHCPFQANRIRDLSFAKHRFNSTQKPFGRHVLMFKSVIATATQIATSRVGKQESKLASAYLSFLDVERAVTLALLADAGDECNMLIRVMDTERMDVSAVSMNLRAFLSRIHALFVDEHCWKLGYTQYMVQQLQEPVLLLAMDGQKTLGCAAGVPVDIKRRCVQRMANWVHLARETIRAEIPEFEIIYAMRAFNLGELSQSLGAPAQGSQHELGSQTMSQLRASCDSLAEFVCVNPTALFSQLNDVRPIAQQMLMDPSCTGTIAAWAMAVAECQKDPRFAKLHPVGALRPVLMAFGAYGPSTSGLEQNFSQILNLAGTNRPDKWGGYIQDELVIKQPWSKDHIDRAVALAPKIWAKIYGPVRRPNVRVRMDLHKGAPARARDVITETSWIRRRRADVQGVVSQKRPVDLMSAPGTRTVGLDGWTADHEKEVKFQQNKRQKRFHDSVLNGEIPEDQLACASEDPGWNKDNFLLTLLSLAPPPSHPWPHPPRPPIIPGATSEGPCGAREVSRGKAVHRGRGLRGGGGEHSNRHVVSQVKAATCNAGKQCNADDTTQQKTSLCARKDGEGGRGGGGGPKLSSDFGGASSSGGAQGRPRPRGDGETEGQCIRGEGQETVRSRDAARRTTARQGCFLR